MIDVSVLSSEELATYNKLKNKLPSTIIDSDYAIFVALLVVLIQQSKTNITELYRQFDVEHADEYYLKAMAGLVGYRWIDSFTTEINRSRLTYHMYRRKYRGTIDSIKNLIRVSLDESVFSDTSENKNIVITDDPAINGIGIIKVNLPEIYKILRLDLDQVRPAGTIIQFIYHIIIGLADHVIQVQNGAAQYTIQIQNASAWIETIDATDSDLQYLPKFCRDNTGRLRTLGTIWYRPIALLTTSPRYLNELSIEINSL